MLRQFVRRLSLALVTVFGVLTLVFVTMRVIPGDPAVMLAGLDASPEQITVMRHKLGIDQPIPVQFVRYIADVAHGDFGYSIRSSRPVFGEVAPAIENTFKLVVLTILLATALGIGFGLVTALRPSSLTDHLMSAIAMLGISTPSFFLALVLTLFFALHLRWLPSIGAGGFEHLILPTLTLTAALMANTTRMTRASLLDVLNADYMRTAYAKGLRPTRALLWHALPNALIPILTVAGLQTSYLLGGAALVETVFSYPGVGWLLVESIVARDFPVVQAAILFVAFATVLVNLFTDLLYAMLDPTIRVGT